MTGQANSGDPAPIDHLEPETLRLLVEGALPPEKLKDIEFHLGACKACQALLEQDIAPGWWAKAQGALRETVPGEDHDASPESSRTADPVLALLDPIEDPSFLGLWDKYRVTGLLGKGGMGVVLKAHDPDLGRFVAVKVLVPHLAANPTARRRFAREARAAAAVCDEHVVAIHGVSEFKTVPFLIMPWIAGESLQKRLRERGALELEEVLRIGLQTAHGLSAAHSQGLIHRDVKPANILLGTGTDRAVLTDFGLARAVDDLDVTNTGMVAGTPRYMSPEQARGEGTLDHRTDLFSLGVVLYEMATGQAPFRGESTLSILRAITEEAPKDPVVLRPELPDWLVDLILRLLSKDPGARPASAREVEEILSRGLAHVQSPRSNPAPSVKGARAKGNREKGSEGPKPTGGLGVMNTVSGEKKKDGIISSVLERLAGWTRESPLKALLVVGLASIVVGLTFEQTSRIAFRLAVPVALFLALWWAYRNVLLKPDVSLWWKVGIVTGILILFAAMLG